MKIVYAPETHRKSIFLAGPTPRSKKVPSWRPEAIELLRIHGFVGDVLVPEPRGGVWSDEVLRKQIHWEWEGLSSATVVAFWVPRDLVDMPAFTTNVEYGLTIASKPLVLGSPEGAPKNEYLMALANRFAIKICHTLEHTMEAAIRKAEQPFAIGR